MGFNNDERKMIGLYVNNTPIKQSSNSSHDKLKDLSDELYNFILNG
jgi:hypothetical protein